MQSIASPILSAIAVVAIPIAVLNVVLALNYRLAWNTLNRVPLFNQLSVSAGLILGTLFLLATPNLEWSLEALYAEDGRWDLTLGAFLSQLVNPAALPFSPLIDRAIEGPTGYLIGLGLFTTTVAFLLVLIYSIHGLQRAERAQLLAASMLNLFLTTWLLLYIVYGALWFLNWMNFWILFLLIFLTRVQLVPPRFLTGRRPSA